MSMKEMTAGLLLLSLAACSDGAPQAMNKGGGQENGAAQNVAADAVPANAPIIVAFGDSLYAGYGVQQDQGFAPELQRALAARGVVARVHNAGVSGDTTAAGLARLAFTLDGLPKAPALALVGLGGNDMLRGLPAAQTRSNLDAILTELDRRNIPVVLTGMMASPNMGAEYVAAFNPIFPDLARAHHATLYPFFLDGVVGHAELIQADGIHPNEAGVDVVIARMVPAITPAVTEALQP